MKITLLNQYYTFHLLEFGCVKEYTLEEKWAEASQLMMHRNLGEDDMMSWAAYFAKSAVTPLYKPSLTGVFPLLDEKAASFPVMQHCMQVIKDTVEKLNPGQIPVVAGDQPLYALMKMISWQNPNFSEDRFVIMLGGLHSEMVFWTNLGKLLDQSGWTDALVEANVITSGRAQGVLHCSHVTRTRRMHTIFLAVLTKLMGIAFVNAESTLPYSEWKEKRCQESPTFLYWNLIRHIEILILMFVRSHRE